MCSIEQLFGWKGGAVAIALTVAPIVTGGYNGSFLFRPPVCVWGSQLPAKYIIHVCRGACARITNLFRPHIYNTIAAHLAPCLLSVG